MSKSKITGLAAASLLVLVAHAGSAQAAAFDILYNFAGDYDGGWPEGNLITDKNGNLYGTTSIGGPNGAGTVFKLAPDGTETQLYHFTGGNDGDLPLSGLLMGPNGNFYGVTEIGGKYGQGNVFKLTPDGILTSIYDFGTATNDGGNPICQLIWGPHDTLLGTTVNGGSGQDGTVFQVTLQGKETILHNFTGADGMYPRAGLTMDAAGNLYGTTFNSSAQNVAGTAFKISNTGVFKTIYNFTTGSGYFPYAPLTLDKDGNLYGTTTAGGAHSYGTVFKLTTAGELTLLYSFKGGKDGADPTSPVFIDKAGNLLGTTNGGGKGDYGIIYSLAPATGKITTLYTFTGATGSYSQAGLVNDKPLGGSYLYGTTYTGGASGNGVIFRIQH